MSDQLESGNLSSRSNYRSQGNEIELRDLWKVIWQGRWVILALTLLTSLVAISYAVMAQELWSSRAVIVAPSMKQIETHLQQVKRLYPAFGEFESKSLEELIDNNKILDRYIDAYNSSFNKIAFFDSNEDFKQIRMAALEAGETDLEKLYYEWNSRITAKPKKDTISNAFLLSAQGISRSNSLELLKDYSEYVNSIVSHEIIEDLQVTIKAQQVELIQTENSLKRQLQQQVSSLDNKQVALATAPAVEIEDPRQRNFTKDVLWTQMAALFFQTKMYEVESKIYLLEQSKINKQTIRCFRYVVEPMASFKQNKPNRVLIVFLGLFLGGGIGIGIVFIRFARRSNKLRSC
ncbi:Wzz/FepE/Etk N-terminal domain-containing protein [Halodesulfovibrio aestuarii]|uniref:Wzz/FepE/Etk N-terminal domain-containing protein n=1 Tax=Halodesulfovibrio aestuarii TaxID=126333 RepID=UPI0003F63419